jgi:hypothetical protein
VGNDFRYWGKEKYKQLMFSSEYFYNNEIIIKILRIFLCIKPNFGWCHHLIDKRWVGQQLGKSQLMIDHACFHSWGLGAENSILVTTERFMGSNQIITSYADGKPGLEPAHRAGSRRCFVCKMGIPQSPIQLERSM